MVPPSVHTAGMCDICDGTTYEASWQRIQDLVASRSWAIQGVEAAAHQRPWAYTIGLTESFGHPELVITDGTWPTSVEILNMLGEWIRDGDEYDVGSVVDAGEFRIELGAVHASFLHHGLCASWSAYYEWAGTDPGPLQVLQVMTTSRGTCEHQRARRADLAVPGAFSSPAGPNRAARRRAARGRR